MEGKQITQVGNCKFYYNEFDNDQYESLQSEKQRMFVNNISAFPLNAVQVYHYDQQGRRIFYCRLGDFDVSKGNFKVSFSLRLNDDDANFTPTQGIDYYFQDIVYTLDDVEVIRDLIIEIKQNYESINTIVIQCEGKTNHKTNQWSNSQKVGGNGYQKGQYGQQSGSSKGIPQQKEFSNQKTTVGKVTKSIKKN